MADDAKVEDGDKGRLRKTLKQLRKERDEENEVRALLEEMQQNLDEAHARASETERRLCQELEDYMCSWDREVGRPNNLIAHIQQMMQSNDTKSENLGKDFTEILERTETAKASLPMESVAALIAEWFSLREMIRLQEISALIYDKLKE